MGRSDGDGAEEGGSRRARAASEPDRPVSRDRRKLLVAFGFGAANVAVLRRLGSGSDSPGRAVPSGSASGPPPTEVALVSASAGPAPRGPGVDPTSRGPLDPGALPGAPPVPGPDHVFDVVIRSGRVMDPESGFDGVLDVGVDGGRVVAFGPGARPLAGRTVIDATGRVVAPGFVDLLSYEPNPFGVWLKLADGVTTNLAMHGVNNYAHAFFERYRNRSPIHFGGAFHHHFMRGIDVGAGVEDDLDILQQAELLGLAKQGLSGGFAGISFSPEYSPGTTTAEMELLAHLARRRGHVCFFHVRHSDPQPPGSSLEAIDEVLGLAARTGVPVHIEHLTSTGGTRVMAEALDAIEAARDSGLDVTACLYPYDFWGTFLGSPRFSAGWRERYGLAAQDLQIAGTTTRLTEATLGAATAENRLVAALGSIPEEEIRLALARPWTIVASDSIPTRDRNNHPRGRGRSPGRSATTFDGSGRSTS